MPNKQSVQINSEMLDLSAVVKKIRAGEFLSIAADEQLLLQLPAGNWIGGITSSFINENDKIACKDKLFVNTITGTEASKPPRVSIYDNTTISRIAKDAPSHGFTLLILPLRSDVHLNYSKNASDFANMFFTPIIGWVSGTNTQSDANSISKVGFGPGGNSLFDQHAVALHVPLPAHQMANLSIINLYEEVKDVCVEFPKTGYTVESCVIDGVTTNLAQYIKEKAIDARFPLIADYSGVKVNVSMEFVDTEANKVMLCAPVFKGVKYRFGQPVDSFSKLYDNELKRNQAPFIFSFNCIQNHLYSEIESKHLFRRAGIFTYGEIAYQLLNQTHVFMTLTEG